jgi:hypothetical protein
LPPYIPIASSHIASCHIANHHIASCHIANHHIANHHIANHPTATIHVAMKIANKLPTNCQPSYCRLSYYQP